MSTAKSELFQFMSELHSLDFSITSFPSAPAQRLLLTSFRAPFTLFSRLFTTSRGVHVMWNSCFISSRKNSSSRYHEPWNTFHCWWKEFNKINWMAKANFPIAFSCAPIQDIQFFSPLLPLLAHARLCNCSLFTFCSTRAFLNAF